MSDIVMRSIDPGRVRRVLDLGCGAGAQVRRLAALLPHATFTGVDISPANITAAEIMRQKGPAAERTRFVLTDYMTFRDDPFDLVLSDGVLHYVNAPDDQLAARLAADVAERGTLIVAMATDSLYNRSFGLARRALRVAQSAAIDGLILRVGRWLHGAEMSDEMIAERIHYMYMPPRRLMGPRFQRQLEASGLRYQARHPMRSTSLSQLTHAVTVFHSRKV
jgi:trans-aconitate methyltransferase